MQDRHGELVAAVKRRAFDGPGSMSPAMRRGLAGAGDVPPALREFAETVRERASHITDADVAGILAAGYTEDQVYEIAVSAALGAGLRRLEAGLRAIADITDLDGVTDGADGAGVIGVIGGAGVTGSAGVIDRAGGVDVIDRAGGVDGTTRAEGAGTPPVVRQRVVR